METLSESVSRTCPIASSRKILHIATLAATALAVTSGLPQSAEAAPARPLRAKLSQAGQSLILTLRTSAPEALAKLDRLPNAGTSHYLCLELQQAGHGGERRLCLGGAKKVKRRVGLELLNAAGKVTDRDSLAAEVKRPSADKLVLALLPSLAGLPPHRYRWRVVADLGHCSSRQAKSCAENLPAQGTRAFRLRPVRAIGCIGGGAGLITNGPRDRKVVALTFDDGPSEYTAGFLQVLREKQVHGTFFEIGQEMPGREATMRQILAEGNEIGDHTMNHVEYPDYAQIAGASERIAAYTHFKPCLFRPPGGAVDSGVIATAAGLGMQTITWDVDPADWSTPGSAAVYSRIVDAAQPGSIILMHDGGGDRSGTLAALPAIIDTLRARGYRFATVTELLGQRMIYKPYG
jgi:peptidoglycan/xylan/chitin deacetylase (PgdA/CDA1 family)